VASAISRPPLRPEDTVTPWAVNPTITKETRKRGFLKRNPHMWRRKPLKSKSNRLTKNVGKFGEQSLQATGAKNRTRVLFMTWHADHAQIVCRNSLKTACNKPSAQMTDGRSDHWGQPTGIFRRSTALCKQHMVEMERHLSVCLSSGAQIKIRRPEMRLW
jgi:hypothetical protein